MCIRRKSWDLSICTCLRELNTSSKSALLPIIIAPVSICSRMIITTNPKKLDPDQSRQYLTQNHQTHPEAKL
jgi:hypothetical protein